MNKQSYLSELEQRLAALSPRERADILRDIEEYFNEGAQRGLTEDEIAIKLGSPKKLAETILAEAKIKRIEQAGSVSQKFSAIWAAFIAILLLTPFNLIFILFPLFIITLFMMLGWPIVILLLITLPIVLGINFFLSLFVGFNIFALFAILLFILFWGGFVTLALVTFSFLTYLYFKAIVWIFRWNISFIKSRIK